MKELAEVLLEKNPTVLRAAKHAYRRVREMSWDDAEDYLFAKMDQSRFLDPEKGREKGMAQFLDEKSYRPGLGPIAGVSALTAFAGRRSQAAAAALGRHRRRVARAGLDRRHLPRQSRTLQLWRRHPSGQPHRARPDRRPACLASIDELPEGVDVALLALPAGGHRRGGGGLRHAARSAPP